MGVMQETAAEQWNLALSKLREVVPQAIEHLQHLEAAVQGCYHSSEMGPEEWSEQAADMECFIVPDERTETSPEESVRRTFELVRSALESGDRLVNRGCF